MKKSKLDTDERLLLAVQASRRGDQAKAMDHLAKILQAEPSNGKARHLRASLYASQGAYDRAVAEMALALECEPDLHVARFQLGLLHITAGRVAEASEAWEPLKRLGEGHYLFHLSRGMMHLGRLQYAECIADLKKGMAMNQESPHLNGDMRKVIAAAEQRMATGR